MRGTGRHCAGLNVAMIFKFHSAGTGRTEMRDTERNTGKGHRTVTVEQEVTL